MNSADFMRFNVKTKTANLQQQTKKNHTPNEWTWIYKPFDVRKIHAKIITEKRIALRTIKMEIT